MSTIATANAKQDASRQNGAKSNGPVTEAGKARSARNATKHGLTGGPVVLPHESQDTYDALKRGLAATYGAASAAEWSLIDEMAASRWRLSRIELMETAILHQAYERVMQEIEAEDEGSEGEPNIDPDRVMAMAFADVAENSQGFRILDRHQRTLWRSYDRALQELQTIQQLRHAEAMQAAQQQKSATRQNEPRRTADYSSLPRATDYPQGSQFMQAAFSHLEKENTAMGMTVEGRGDQFRQAKAA